ncbi:hypothetical protein ACYOEI_40030, partial [Singulisphaera rosea]
APAAEAQKAATSSLSQIEAGLARRKQALVDNKQWYASYRVSAENFTGDMQFAWPWIDVVNGRKGGRIFTYCSDPGFRGEAPLKRWCGYEDGVGVIRTNMGVDITPGLNSWHLIFNMYTDFLSINTYDGIELPEVVTATQYNVKNEPWLPEAIGRNRGHYRVLPSTEVVDGRPCHVVEYPGFDKIWVDVERGCSVLRRETSWYLDQPLRRRVENLDHIRIGPAGVWLPRVQVVEQFCSLKDLKENWGKVSHRRVHRITSLKLSDIDDSLLAVDVPDGALVTDHIRKLELIKLPPTS